MRKFSRGDTIIEVMFSIVVFSLLAVGSYMVMNRGSQIVQRSLEITLVRQQIDGQISLIRYIKDNDPTAWQQLTRDYIVSNPTNISGDALGECPSPNSANSLPNNAFFIQTGSDTLPRPVRVTSANFEQPPVYARVNLDGDNSKTQSIFAQITTAESKVGSNAGRAYDVYVNACWDSVGSNVPVTIGTVTRIYDRN